MKAIGLPLILVAAVAAGQSSTPRATQAAASPLVQQAAAVGRFQIVSVQVEVLVVGRTTNQVVPRVLLLDTATGRSWQYKEAFDPSAGLAVGWDEFGDYVPPGRPTQPGR